VAAACWIRTSAAVGWRTASDERHPHLEVEKSSMKGVWVYFSVSFYGGFGVGDWGLATYSCIYFKIIHCYGIFHTTFIGDGFVRLGFFFTDEYVLTATSQRCKHQSTQGEQGRGYQPSNPILLVSGRATSVGPATVRPR
jgi:hypothetical protein